MHLLLTEAAAFRVDCDGRFTSSSLCLKWSQNTTAEGETFEIYNSVSRVNAGCPVSMATVPNIQGRRARRAPNRTCMLPPGARDSYASGHTSRRPRPHAQHLLWFFAVSQNVNQKAVPQNPVVRFAFRSGEAPSGRTRNLQRRAGAAALRNF